MTQKARGRDYFDIYMICMKYNFDFMDLIKKARQKFDYQINYLELGKNLLKAGMFLDDPILLKEIKRDEMEQYFLEIAQKIDIFE